MIEREVASFQTPQVTHHLRFGVVRVENRVGEEGGGARQGGSKGVRAELLDGIDAENREDAV